MDLDDFLDVIGEYYQPILNNMNIKLKLISKKI